MSDIVLPVELVQLMPKMIEDAEKRTRVDASQWTVARCDSAGWSDSSLGCPEPGGAYLQSLTRGFTVVLDSTERQLEYHVCTNYGPYFKYCSG